MSNITYIYKDDVNAQNDPWLVLNQIKTVLNGAGDTGIEPSSFSTNQKIGMIPLRLSDIRIILSNDFADETVVTTGSSEKAPGGYLASLGVIFSINRVNGATDKAARLVAKANSTGELQFPTIVLPNDLDNSANMTFHVMANMAGATDTPVLSIGAFFGVGDTNAGGDTAALSTTVADKTVTILAADVAAYPNFLNISVIPGAHTTNALWIYAAWLTYTKKA